MLKVKVMRNESYEIWPSAKYDVIIVASSADELIHVKPKIEVRWLMEKGNVLVRHLSHRAVIGRHIIHTWW